MPRKPLLETPSKTTAGKTIGRPRKEPPEGAAELIKAAAADGFSVVGIAMLMGCDKECLNRWMKEHPDLKQAFEFGREKERQTLHNKLYRDATEGTGKDSIIAAMFLLKARHGYKEGADVGESNARVQIDIRLPGALPPTQYAEVIDNG